MKSVMQMRGMTQRALAEASGLTEAAISRYLSGEREPKSIALARIAEALQVSADELLGISIGSADEVEEAIRVIARSADAITAEQKRSLISALIG